MAVHDKDLEASEALPKAKEPTQARSEAQVQLLPRSSAVVRAFITPISSQGWGTGDLN